MLIQHERGSSLTIIGTPRKQRDRMRGFLPAFFLNRARGEEEASRWMKVAQKCDGYKVFGAPLQLYRASN
jgi:hypothetical protein